MEWQGWFTLSLTAAALGVLALTRTKPHLVMMAVLTTIGLSQILSPTELLSGFSNPGLATVAAMYVIAAGLQSSGSIDLLVNTVLGTPNSVRGAMRKLFAQRRRQGCVAFDVER